MDALSLPLAFHLLRSSFTVPCVDDLFSLFPLLQLCFVVLDEKSCPNTIVPQQLGCNPRLWPSFVFPVRFLPRTVSSSEAMRQRSAISLRPSHFRQTRFLIHPGIISLFAAFLFCHPFLSCFLSFLSGQVCYVSY